MRVPVLVTVPTLALLAACSAGGQPDPGNPTYHQDVAPILTARCGGCHADGAIAAGLRFDTYDQASALSSLIADRVESGAMPPFPAAETAECPNPWGFLHDPRLSDAEVSTLVTWDEQGSPEGDPDTAAPLSPPVVQKLSGVNQTLSPRTPWTTKPASELSDELVCMVLDPGLTETGWLQGIEIDADNLEVVHHVVVTVDTEAEGDALAGADGWYECFGGPMTSGGQMVGGWVPGAAPVETPEGSAIRIPAGAKLIAQMHYHGVETAQPDATSVRLRWADSPPPSEAYVELIGNAAVQQADGNGLQPGPNDDGLVARFEIPPGVSGHTETARYVIDEGGDTDFGVFMVANHMHYVGTRMRAWVEPAPGSPTTETQCLLDTPEWDFDWQLLYGYDVRGGRAPVVHSGDVLVLQCTYDNTLANPGVQRALAETGLDAPIEVGMGEGSLDEMCIAAFGVVPL